VALKQFTKATVVARETAVPVVVSMAVSLFGSNCGSLRVEHRDEMPPRPALIAPAAAGGDDAPATLYQGELEIRDWAGPCGIPWDIGREIKGLRGTGGRGGALDAETANRGAGGLAAT
jgi:hypothetical protein